MGVMLSLEGSERTRRRRRRGQHKRTHEDQAFLDALAAFLRADVASAGRCLSKVSRQSLSARMLPAARALAQAADRAVGEAAAPEDALPDYALSVTCLLGLCTGSAAGSSRGPSSCSSPVCQHYCHGAPPSAAASGEPAGLP
jgi:hypothetical protein